MRTIRCADCYTQAPMGESFLLDGLTLCQPCAEVRHKEAGGKLEGLQRATDPTICARCKLDCGNSELPVVKGLPLCEACKEKVMNPSFPRWVKLSIAAMLVLATVSMVHNWRFFQGYVEVQRGHRQAKAGRYHEAHRLLASATQRVPEYPDLALVAKTYEAYAAADDGDVDRAYALLSEVAREYGDDPELDRQVRQASAARYAKQAKEAMDRAEYSKAVDLMDKALAEVNDPNLRTARDFCQVHSLMEQERSREALDLARRLRADHPEVENLRTLVLQAEIGSAFEAKDWDGFLAKTRELGSKDPNNAVATAATASALACKYAATGEESFKTEAAKTLEQARALCPPEEQEGFKDYEERILYRLRTREIITKKEYDRRLRSAASAPATAPADRQEERP